jgi:hypothetical protein
MGAVMAGPSETRFVLPTGSQWLSAWGTGVNCLRGLPLSGRQGMVPSPSDQFSGAAASISSRPPVTVASRAQNKALHQVVRCAAHW